MLDVIEDNRNEFKTKLPKDLEETIVAFLIAKSGNIFISVDDKVNS